MRKLTYGNSYVYKQKRADAAETLNIDGRKTYQYYLWSNKDCSDYKNVVL